MEIVDIEVDVAPMATSWLTETVIANPMSIYPEYHEQRSSWYRRMSAGIARVTVADGTQGVGFIGGGRAAASATLLDEQIRDLLLGRSCFATDAIAELLARATSYYGRGGITSGLLSGIDIALWDLKGKLTGKPVYELLGGPAQKTLRPYLTSWDAGALKEFGIRDVKLAMPYGPAHGEEGMRANEDAVRRARELIGSDGFIALDCYMAWDVPYTLEMERRLRDFSIAWIEEPVAAEDYEGYARIRAGVACKVTGGEHLYKLADFRRLIDIGGVDIVQPDIYRAGGPTVLKQITALAKASGRQLICHGVGLATFHFMLSNDPATSPRCEYLDVQAGADSRWIFADEPRPQRGLLTIPDRPGFGYRLDEDAFAEGTTVTPIW